MKNNYSRDYLYRAKCRPLSRVDLAEEAQVLRYGRGEEAMLQLVDAPCKRLHRVVRMHRTSGLQEMTPVVIIFVDEVYGDTTYRTP